MALAARPMHFPAYAPIDEATRPELLDIGQAVLLAENVRPTENGGYETRRGFATLALERVGGSDRSAGYRMFAHGKQTLVVGDGPALDSYSPAGSFNVSRGRICEATMRMMGLPGAGGSSGRVSDVVVCGNYVVALNNGSDGVSAVVVDAVGGGIVKEREVVAASHSIGLLATYDTVVMAFFWANSSGTITYKSIDLASASTIATGWSASADACTDGPVAATTLYASVCSSSDRVAIAHANSAGGTNRLTVRTFTSSGQIATTTINTSSADPSACAITADSAGTFLVAWNETTNIRVCGLTAALAVNATTTTCMTAVTVSATSANHPIDIVASSTNGAGRVFTNNATDATGDVLHMRDFTTSAGAIVAGGSQISIFNARKIGRAFRNGTRYYATCRGWEAAKLDAVVCDVTDTVSYRLRPVANIRPNLATSQPWTKSPTFGTTVLVPVSTQASGGSYAGELAVLDFASSQRWEPVRFSRSTFISGAILTEFDGQRAFEAAFLIHPPKPTCADAGSGAGPNGSYRYVAIYEYVDANGGWHTSGVSDPSASVTVVDNTINVTVRPLSISLRVAGTIDQIVRIDIYRTAAGGEPPYYFLDSIANDQTTSTIVYADSLADATLITRSKLYAPSLPGVNGGSQDHRAPPGQTHLDSGNGVLVGSQSEDVWASSQDTYGEGLWWSPIWQAPVPGEGEITGIKFQDGTFYIFKRRSIFALPAEAPSDNGAVGGLGVPRRLAADVGCIDARSLVVTNLGIFFQSERGIEILTRAQTVEPIGEKIVDTLTSYPICTSATVDPIRDVVYFELAAGESSGVVTGSGRTAIFDLTLKAWISTDRRASYAGVADTPAQSGAMIWDGTEYQYAWLETGGRVRQAHNFYFDSLLAGSAFIVPRVEYPPLKLGLQQRARFWRAVWLVERLSAAGFKVEHLYDWSTAYSAGDDKTWTEAQTASKRQLHWTLKTGEHQSVRFRVSATAPATLGTGRAFSLIGFSLDVAPKQGPTKATPNLDPSARQ